MNVEHLVVGKRLFIPKSKSLGRKEANTEFVFFIDDDYHAREASRQK
ncbi:MAG: hypothetical protein JRN67_09810 [Nitrososphaerota archaeon]|nr:hypothetical protein [Nitrososphaerota archaeon]